MVFFELIIEVVSMEVDRLIVFKYDQIRRSSQVNKSVDIWETCFDFWDIVFKSFVGNFMKKT